jgi:hypothetical protein
MKSEIIEVFKDLETRADLADMGIAKDAPTWLTPRHIEKCFDPKVQKGWNPTVGDWYFCEDSFRITQIKDLTTYNTSSPEGSFPKEAKQRTDGSWPCDTYIPYPTRLGKLLR